MFKVAPPKKTNKVRFVDLKGNTHFKGNKKGAGKPLSYAIERDQEILIWLLEMRDLHLPIWSLALRKSSESKIQRVTAKNLKQAEAGFKNLVNVTHLHYRDVSQLAKSSLNSWKRNCLVFTIFVPNF